MRPSLALLKGRKNIIGAEIGVGAGQNAKKILENLDIKKLYLIDLWTRFSEYVKELKDTRNYSLKTTNGKQIAEKNLAKWNTRLVWTDEKSADAIEFIENEELDFVYIDGNHNYKYVLEDINLYWTKLKVGGLMAGHDFKPKFPGVIQAVVEKFGVNFETACSNDRKYNVDWWTWKQN